MSLLGSSTYSVTRITGSVTVGLDGYVVAPSTTTTTIIATIRPAKWEELQLLEEGFRNRKVITIYSESEIVIEDLVSYKSENYKVIAIADNSKHGFLSHYKAMAVKEKE